METPVISWLDDALCAGIDDGLSIFFTKKDEATAVARSLCSQCPVKKECLAYSLETNRRYGVWGGVVAHGRKAK